MSMLSILITAAVVLLILSAIAGIFGFRGAARAGCLFSRILFFILVAGFIITLAVMLVRFIF
ncbi:MAG: DUF1328 domain-containing protein [Actinobacteria bacterium]|nr:DUF1328 domain-containing protein [Actinomycetota bacterium]